jgi:ATP-binding cassette subfamily A (ABC1) protein 3
MARLRQLRLLLWKNYILQFRRPIGTIVEIVIPILAMSVLIAIRVLLDNASDAGEQCFSTFDEQSVTKIYPLDDLRPPLKIAYAPSTSSDVNWIMNKSFEILHAANKINDTASTIEELVPFETVQQAIEAAELDETDKTMNHFIGVAVFESLYDAGSGRNDTRYTLRLPHGRSFENSWRTDTVFPVFEEPGPRDDNRYFGGFIQLQYAIERAITAWKVESVANGSSPNVIPLTMRVSQM